MKRALAFLAGDAFPDYGTSLARLRWRRAAASAFAVEWKRTFSAREALAAAESWIVVRDETALPAPGTIPQPPPGRVVLAGPAISDPPCLHTLRELEGARIQPAGDAGSVQLYFPAVAFRSADFPALDGETIENFLERLLARREAHVRDARFLAVPLEDTSERERAELTRHLPEGALRILDVGCGSGGAIAGAKQRRPEWRVTGIELDSRRAARARSRCDRVFEGDLRAVLPDLAAAGEIFDVLVFADILEHLDDPIAALAEARRLIVPGGTVLVSVPNAGHLSIVRDLLFGRFDPLPAGLTDVGHLRWFTRGSLEDALEEAGWRLASIEAHPGAPISRADAFLEAVGQWPGLDRRSLGTYQWIAVARAALPIR